MNYYHFYDPFSPLKITLEKSKKAKYNINIHKISCHAEGFSG